MEKKALHLAKNFSELQKLAEPSNLDVRNVKNACNLLDKLFEKHEEVFIDGDEELAYIYAMRFLESLSYVRKTFKADIKYINALMGSKKSDMALKRAEKLKNDLKERYNALYSKNDTKENTKINSISKDAVILPDQKKGAVTCNDIYKLLKKGLTKVLIVDTRKRSQYDQCHILCERIVNIPWTELHPGCSIVDVNKYLETNGQEIEVRTWNQRSSSDFVLILDWDMQVLDGVNMVKDAIFKWDAEKTLKEPVLLEGGLKSFMSHYPTMVTNPKYKFNIDDSQITTIYPEDIKYPSWKSIEAEKQRLEEEKRKSKLEEQKRLLEETTKKKCLEDALKKKIVVDSKRLRENETEICSLNDVCADIVEDRFNKIHTDRQVEVSVSDIPSLAINRSLKPEIHKVKQNEESVNVSLIQNKNPLAIDRTLKPDLTKDEKNESFDEKITSHPEKSPLIKRLSSNSRTDQDRSDFTARGGAKSIAPPPESEKVQLPPWISQELNTYTNEYYYIDRKTNMRYDTIPDEYKNANIVKTHIDRMETTKTHKDVIEVLKDHSSYKSKSPTMSSTMKRSTSQPNLTDESAFVPSTTSEIKTNKQITEFDLGEVPKLDRCTKPSHNKSFNEFDANRLNSFNPSYRKVNPGLTGLHNMGNTCYMNSVIQALSNTKFLSNYILTGSYRHDINRKNPLGYQGDLINEFACLITALWKGLYKEISPLDFKRMVDSKNEMFRGGEQHDSQEFLLFILDGLHEDLNVGVRNAKSELPGDTDKISDMDRAQLSWKAHVAINDSVIVRMFQGQYRSKVQCDHCFKTSVTFDAFMYLSLPLVTSHSRCSLDECIKLFLAEESMTGACQWFCPKCKTNRNARKKIDIWKLPPYLLIHLKRFSCSGQYRQKLNTFVDFPMDSLSLSDILSNTTSQPHTHDAYHLYAVSNHHGNMESGHYTSYCKNMKEDCWYNYDDDVVTRIKEIDVKTPSAYILFYESYNLKKAAFKT